MHKIIILLAVYDDFSEARNFLTAEGLKEGVDFFLTDQSIVASNFVLKKDGERGEPQILITGMVNNSILATDTFLKMCRSKNPELVTVSCSPYPLKGIFEREIVKTPSTEYWNDLLAAIRDFNSGNLRRVSSN